MRGGYKIKSILSKNTILIFCALVFSLLLFPVKADATDNKMIIINKKKNQLGYYIEGVLTKVFPIATGLKRSYTPEGEFKVVNKVMNPPYYKKNIPGGSPTNPLGPRWLGLSATGGSYGIHGNSNPNSIGTYASAGCIRLKNDDIKWLYEQVPVGTPVKIVWNDNDLAMAFIDNRPLKLYLNNKEVLIATERNSFSQQGKPYVSLRTLGQLLGCSITWNEELGAIEIKSADVVTRLTPNDKNILVNNQLSVLSDAPLVVDGTSYVSKSSIETVFGVDINWDAGKRELYIIANKAEGINPQIKSTQQASTDALVIIEN